MSRWKTSSALPILAVCGKVTPRVTSRVKRGVVEGVEGGRGRLRLWILRGAAHHAHEECKCGDVWMDKRRRKCVEQYANPQRSS
eukprot:312215-Chlamydomonas_euryale.AAC.1